MLIEKKIVPEPAKQVKTLNFQTASKISHSSSVTSLGYFLRFSYFLFQIRFAYKYLILLKLDTLSGIHSNKELPYQNFDGSLVFPVETNKISKTNIDSKEPTGSDFHQNANFHGKYQRASLITKWYELWISPFWSKRNKAALNHIERGGK